MKEKYKKSKIIFWSVLIAGSFLAGILHAANPKIFGLPIIILWMVIMVTICVWLEIHHFLEQQRVLQQLLKDFEETVDADALLAGMDDLLENATGKVFLAACSFNRGVAFIQKEKYAEAMECFLSAEDKYFRKINQAIYWGDIALCHFLLQQPKEALTIMEQKAQCFQTYENNAPVDGLLVLLRLFRLLEEGKLEELEQVLPETRSKWENKRNATEFTILAERLAQRKKQQAAVAE